MVNDEILGGLRSALDRGESFKKAMMTFFNAGYKKEEIEEAAGILNSQGVQPAAASTQVAQSKLVQPQAQTTSNKLEPVMPTNMMQVPVQYQQQAPAVKQKVSNYGDESKDKTLIFILIGVLVFLFGTLLAIFIFKNELISFFSGLFA